MKEPPLITPDKSRILSLVDEPQSAANGIVGFTPLLTFTKPAHESTPGADNDHYSH